MTMKSINYYPYIATRHLAYIPKGISKVNIDKSDSPTEKAELTIVERGLRGTLKKIAVLVGRAADVTPVANMYRSVIVVSNAGKIYTTIYPGFSTLCASLQLALSKMLMMFYALNVKFQKTAASFCYFFVLLFFNSSLSTEVITVD